MGYIISKEQLEGARKRERFFSSLNESISARKRNAYLGEVTVFLSHNHRDKDVLENVIVELKSLGVNVYVDWNDEFMPNVTSGETARRIKEKYLNIMTQGKDFYFMMGTTKKFHNVAPNPFIIIGTFYPKKEEAELPLMF